MFKCDNNNNYINSDKDDNELKINKNTDNMMANKHL